MSRPTWVLIYSIFLFLIGGCSLFNNIGDTQVEKIDALMDKAYSQKDGIEKDSAKLRVNARLDTMSQAKRDSVKQQLEKVFGKDDLVIDENDNIDMTATMQKTSKISDYRKSWTIKFGWIGVFFSILFIVGGVLMLMKSKITIPFILTILSSSMAFGLFQFFIYKADVESGSLITMSSKFGIFLGLGIDVILLIVFMVLDKSYFAEEKFTEDFS